MATVVVYTAGRMKEIEDNCIVSGAVVNGRLILTKKNGVTIDAGAVSGGTTGGGPTVMQAPDGTNYRLSVDNNGILSTVIT